MIDIWQRFLIYSIKTGACLDALINAFVIDTIICYAKSKIRIIEYLTAIKRREFYPGIKLFRWGSATPVGGFIAVNGNINVGTFPNFLPGVMSLGMVKEGSVAM
jgi:hypothetical protein